MTGAEIMAVVGFFVSLFVAAFGVWKYADSKIAAARSELNVKIDSTQALAALARSEISAHKVHAAETFATKAGMQEQTSQLLRAIESVGNRIDGLHERLDRAFERPPTRSRS